MSLRTKRRQARRAQPPSLLQAWTISRATGVGAVSGLLSILVAGLFDPTGEPLIFVYAALLVVTATCGASILWITAFDMRARGTSGRMRPIRGFDLGTGLILLLPSLYALSQVWDDLVARFS
ncbi:hypothetical protein [Sphingosinicella terrae]|uniref:hypothetical protein n=1 Tax=Sphingosinicella terrae TaxID=2172047 RepID=UPI000E0D1EC7|nr:hypothetical protein [Sphingosinicella terrae]